VGDAALGARSATSSARDAGFDHHLVKPVEVDRIQAILEGEAAGL